MSGGFYMKKIFLKSLLGIPIAVFIMTLVMLIASVQVRKHNAGTVRIFMGI